MIISCIFHNILCIIGLIHCVLFAAIDLISTIIALTTVAAAGAAAVAGPGALTGAQPVPTGAGPPTGVPQPGAGMVASCRLKCFVLHYSSEIVI